MYEDNRKQSVLLPRSCLPRRVRELSQNMSTREPEKKSDCCDAEISVIQNDTSGHEMTFCTSCKKRCSVRVSYEREEVLVVQHALLYLKRQIELKIAHTRRMCGEGSYECVCELANANRAYREVIALIDKLLEK